MKKPNTPLTALLSSISFSILLAAHPIQASTYIEEDPTNVDAENIAFILGSKELRESIRSFNPEGGIEKITNNEDGTYSIEANSCAEVVKVNRGLNLGKNADSPEELTTAPESIELLGTFCWLTD